jgi:electron-transferring-flavoprotein dehydrogenase
MHNTGNYIISLGNLCRWLGQQAEQLGVEIYPGFAAQDIIIEDGQVCGVITGDHGLDRQGQPRAGVYTPGIELRARYTLFGEGARGHLGKRLQAHFQLQGKSDPPHYALGLKELWEIDPARHESGLVIHAAGWPLDNANPGGGFLYHLADNLVSVGLIADLNYRNPYLSPFNEFQRFKHHPTISQYLDGGKRISYGARAINKGGYNSLPQMIFPGGALIGCNLGTLNFAKIKGVHTAMKSGMLAAEAVMAQWHDTTGALLNAYVSGFRQSWLHDELYQSRNFGPSLHRFGNMIGGAFNLIDQNVFRGRLPFTLHDTQADHASLAQAKTATPIAYAAPDGKLSFDRLSSVYLANTSHVEEQPIHLRLSDADVPVSRNLPLFDEPAQRYCPAGVYEIVEAADRGKRFQINAANCVHCKACDIKDPAQNITWVAPEGGSGPNYANM